MYPCGLDHSSFCHSSQTQHYIFFRRAPYSHAVLLFALAQNVSYTHQMRIMYTFEFGICNGCRIQPCSHVNMQGSSKRGQTLGKCYQPFRWLHNALCCTYKHSHESIIHVCYHHTVPPMGPFDDICEIYPFSRHTWQPTASTLTY